MDFNIYLFLALVFVITFFLGRLLERIRIPWIFSALLIGLGLAAYNPFPEITSSESFSLLAHLGMYFLLFLVGFELDIGKLRKSSKFLTKSTFTIILSEAIIGSLMVKIFFPEVAWLVAILVATSFATVGEAVLLPILDEFKLTKTKLGQTILGIGALDDIIEVLVIILVSVSIGYKAGHSSVDLWTNLGILLALFGIVVLLYVFRNRVNLFRYKDISSLFLFAIFLIFLFVGMGYLMEISGAALGALLAGLALQNIIPKKTLNKIKPEIKNTTYAIFAPIFFLWVGLDVSFTGGGIAGGIFQGGSWIWQFILLVLIFTVIIKATKILSSYLVTHKKLGNKKALILGISLCVKLSTSIVIIKMLFEQGLLPVKLYSVFIGTKILFKFIVPFLLAYLITHWKIGFSKIKEQKEKLKKKSKKDTLNN